jgi:hypothetical protein
MNPFEEKFTAWVDAKLSGQELAAFEKELAEYPEAAEDKEDMLRIGELLRRHPTVPRLTNPDFFNYQLQERIAAETPRQPEPAEKRSFFWLLRQLAMPVGFSVAVAAIVYLAPAPRTPDADGKSTGYAKILKTRTEDPSITASQVYDSGVAVVWLDGLQDVPRDFAQK